MVTIRQAFQQDLVVGVSTMVMGRAKKVSSHGSYQAKAYNDDLLSESSVIEDIESGVVLDGQQKRSRTITLVLLLVFACALATSLFSSSGNEFELWIEKYFTPEGGVSIKSLFVSTFPASTVDTAAPSIPMTMVKHGNIIFILADDMGYNSLRSDVTPFLVNMRDQGIALTKYYTQELCTPARASLLTGRYPLSVGLQHGTISVKTNGTLDLDETTIADVLKENGYTNYMYGKWNLGNASPRELPTARGFHQFLGFLASEQDYWSKHTPSYQEFRDFLYADTECYYMYDGDDLNHYSTNLYREKAIATIQQHDFDSSPMFMYLSMQAPHAPFADLEGMFTDGVPLSYVDPTLFEYINTTMVGQTQKQYYLSLNIMDGAVKDIYTALEERGQAGRTYIIFASDNGGCPTSGGRNTPLRGGKSTLFEGGTMVESFVYSPGLPVSARGRTYQGLFHVSDWFPTILGFADIKYTPIEGFELDGFDQSSSMMGDAAPPPREYVLYNYYYNVDGQNYEFFTRGGGAIRNNRFKLLHTYLSSEETWFDNTTVYQSDDNLSNLLEVFCSAPNAITGNYTYFLFDLEKDPEERVNLYDTTDLMMSVQQELYDQLMVHAAKSKRQNEVIGTEETNLVRWHENGDYITPWLEMEDEDIKYASKPFPKNCGMFSSAVSTSS